MQNDDGDDDAHFSSLKPNPGRRKRAAKVVYGKGIASVSSDSGIGKTELLLKLDGEVSIGDKQEYGRMVIKVVKDCGGLFGGKKIGDKNLYVMLAGSLKEMEAYIRGLIPNLTQLCDMPTKFVQMYCHIAAHKFFFFCDPSRRGKACIKKILLSNCLQELMELHQEGEEGDAENTENWFSLASA